MPNIHLSSNKQSLWISSLKINSGSGRWWNFNSRLTSDRWVKRYLLNRGATSLFLLFKAWKWRHASHLYFHKPPTDFVSSRVWSFCIRVTHDSVCRPNVSARVKVTRTRGERRILTLIPHMFSYTVEPARGNWSAEKQRNDTWNHPNRGKKIPEDGAIVL